LERRQRAQRRRQEPRAREGRGGQPRTRKEGDRGGERCDRLSQDRGSQGNGAVEAVSRQDGAGESEGERYDHESREEEEELDRPEGKPAGDGAEGESDPRTEAEGGAHEGPKDRPTIRRRIEVAGGARDVRPRLHGAG